MSENHKTHIFKHIQYSMGFNIKKDKTFLPKDKRKIPWPYIRKYQLGNVKTFADYHIELIKKFNQIWKQHIQDHAERVFG